MGLVWVSQGKCVMCGATNSNGYIATRKSGDRQICLECLKELDERRDTFIAGVGKLLQAAKRGAEAFTDELDRQTKS